MSYNKNQIRDFSPQSLKMLNDNFDNLFLKVFGEIGNKDIKQKSIKGSNIEDGAIDSLQIKDAAIDYAKIGTAEIVKAFIRDLTAEVAKIHDLEVVNAIIDDAHIDTLQVRYAAITTAKIKDLAVTSAKIAKAAIGDAHISDLNADKLSAGTVDTARVTILGPNGRIKIANNRIQVFDYPNHNLAEPLFERVVLGNVNGDDSIYGLRIRGSDGTTMLFDDDGLHEEGITDGAITNAKISDNANIDGAKLDIASVVTKINEGTTVIQGSKIFLDSTTLDILIGTIKDVITDHGETISSQSASITALSKSIALKVSTQTYETNIANQNSKIENLNTKGLGMKVNYGTFSIVNTGELYVHGFNSEGVASDIDGFILVSGTKMVVKKQILNPNYKIAKGYIIWDNTLQWWYLAEYTAATQAWKRYNNAMTEDNTVFTPGSQHYFCGYVEMDGAENFTFATLWNTILDYKQIVNIVSVENLESRLVTAEASLTVQAKEIALKIDTTDVASGYTAKSEFEQTVNGINMTFDEIGGNNSIPNSMCAADLTFWRNNMSIGSTALSAAIKGKCFRVQHGGITTPQYGYSSRFNIKANTKYTISGWFRNDAVTTKGIKIYVLTSNNPDATETSTAYTASHLFVNYADTSSSWQYKKFTFTTGADAVNAYIRIDNLGAVTSGTNGYVYFVALKLEEGSIATAWTPHADELYSGNTRIDGKGVSIFNGALTVENSNGEATIDASKLMLRIRTYGNGALTIANGATTATISIAHNLGYSPIFQGQFRIINAGGVIETYSDALNIFEWDSGVWRYGGRMWSTDTHLFISVARTTNLQNSGSQTIYYRYFLNEGVTL